MQTANGSLVILDAHKKAAVFWNGTLLPVRRLSVVEGNVFLHFERGSVTTDLTHSLREAGINVREVA